MGFLILFNFQPAINSKTFASNGSVNVCIISSVQHFIKIFNLSTNFFKISLNINNLASIKACEKNGFKFSSKKNNQVMYTCNLDRNE